MSSRTGNPSVSTITMSHHQLKVTVVPELATEVDQAVKRSQQYLLSLQKPEGYWIGELIVDTTLVSDYMLYMYWKGEVDFQMQSRCVKHILDRQLPDGGWNI